MENPKLHELLQKALALPLDPGVYIMYNARGVVIYVGKAKALKNRVCQYFRAGSDHAPKVARMVANVDRFEYIVCGSEFEALVLEASLIKQYQPKYNILLKDDKGYHYIRVSPYPWRRIAAVKQVEEDGARYLGPYYSGYVVGQSVDQACKIFGLPTCNRRFPQDIGKGRPCLNRSIGICSGPCTGRVPLADYEESVDRALAFLNGGQREAVRQLQADMEQASEALQFEKAARLRDRINAIKKMADKQTIVSAGVKDQDVIAYAATPEKGCFEVFHFTNGSLSDRAHYFVEPEGDEDPLGAFILQYYWQDHPVPAQITLHRLPADADRLAEWLRAKRGKAVRLHVPERGDQRQLVEMCLSNAEERLINTAGRKSREESALEELAALLRLPAPPRRIESYDISHTAGDEMVAGMVVFAGARPSKRDYRQFKVRHTFGMDDTASMAEVVARRMEEYHQAAQQGKTDGFGALPDLILLDGGLGQLHAVLPVLAAAGVQVPTFGMVKDSRHHTRAIVGAQGEIEIKANRSVFAFVSGIQDEVHRFAITFHRKRSSGRLTRSTLLAIPGVGPKRAAALLKTLGSVQAVAAADEEQLQTVPGMNRAAAAAVWAHYHGAENS